MTDPPSIGLNAIERAAHRSFAKDASSHKEIEITIHEITPTAPDWAFARTESRSTAKTKTTKRVDTGDEGGREEGGDGGAAEEEAATTTTTTKVKGKASVKSKAKNKTERKKLPPRSSSSSNRHEKAEPSPSPSQPQQKSINHLPPPTAPGKYSPRSSQDLFILQKIKLADQRADGQGQIWEWRVARYCCNNYNHFDDDNDSKGGGDSDSDSDALTEVPPSSDVRRKRDKEEAEAETETDVGTDIMMEE